MGVRYKRVVAALDEEAKARLCESSGSEHSPDNFDDLYDLVSSFIEGDDDQLIDGREKERNGRSDSDSFDCFGSETIDMLQGLLPSNKCYEGDAKEEIRAEAELAWRAVGNSSSKNFKRHLMSHLRDRGFDAGICKSRWEKTGRYPAGDYEYIDVKVSGTRYIVEVNLGGQFEVARPTNCYLSLLNFFPQIYVGEVDEVKQIVRIMSMAMKGTLKSKDMHVPPWRRNEYMQAKWSASYERKIDPMPSEKASDCDSGTAMKRSIVFERKNTVLGYCREDFGSKIGLKVGHLAMAFKENQMLSG
ncbi:Protein of unknown function PDDEXK-like [Dillenia turbinata]|uniref:Uncharacterized protein n=1 Tax=Dillenia turbinata TaxID=194707 RepID=A0AAN8VD42_9MAGN